MDFDMEFEAGDRVEYYPVGTAIQTSIGIIKRIITEPEQVGVQTVQASEESPHYVKKEIIFLGG